MLIVIYDACVLYPAPLRDLLMRLSMTDLFRAKWTEDIHQEWIRNLLANRPDLTETQLCRTRDLMNEHGGDCLVTGYKSIINALSLPDPDDRHVLAAAIKSNASIIVTYNLKDFPVEVTDDYGIESLHPDDFISSLIDLDVEKICHSVKQHRLSLKNSVIDLEEYLINLERVGLTKTVTKLKDWMNEI